MKEVLIHCNGRELTVRRIGPVKVKLVARSGGPPLKPCGWRVVEEEVATSELRSLVDSDLYEKVEQ
jgi:hypothetical protein